MIPNKQFSKADHPSTRVLKESIHEKKSIPLEKLRYGNVEKKFPVQIDEKTIVFIKNPTPEKIKQLRLKYSQRNLYGKPEPIADTTKDNTRASTE